MDYEKARVGSPEHLSIDLEKDSDIIGELVEIVNADGEPPVSVKSQIDVATIRVQVGSKIALTGDGYDIHKIREQVS